MRWNGQGELVCPRQSTTSGGSPGENALAESFFHSLKADVIHGATLETDDKLRASSDGYQTPAAFERSVAHKSTVYEPERRSR